MTAAGRLATFTRPLLHLSGAAITRTNPAGAPRARRTFLTHLPHPPLSSRKCRASCLFLPAQPSRWQPCCSGRVSRRSATLARTRATARCRSKGRATRPTPEGIARCSAAPPTRVRARQLALASRACCPSRPSARACRLDRGCSARCACARALATAIAEGATPASTWRLATPGARWWWTGKPAVGCVRCLRRQSRSGKPPCARRNPRRRHR